MLRDPRSSCTLCPVASCAQASDPPHPTPQTVTHRLYVVLSLQVSLLPERRLQLPTILKINFFTSRCKACASEQTSRASYVSVSHKSSKLVLSGHPRLHHVPREGFVRRKRRRRRRRKSRRRFHVVFACETRVMCIARCVLLLA